MQDSLIGLRHLEQARIPISERLNSGTGWIEGMTHSLCWAGALPNSQSPIDAYGGTVMGTSMRLRVSKVVVNIAHIGKVHTDK